MNKTMDKTIVMVGVLDVASSTNVSMAKSFMKFGYTVIPVNYRTIIRNSGFATFYKVLVDTVKHYKPILTVFCKCNGIEPDIVLECNKYSKTWLWNMDPIETIKRCPEVIQHAKNANFSSCTGGGVNDYFRRSGVLNGITIFDGLDTDIFKPTYVLDRYKADISFIGNETPQRNKFKRILESAKLDVKFYGMGYNDPVYNEEFSQVCSASNMMLSLNTYNDIPDYFSNRLLRYLGCGTCVLHYDPTDTLYKYFVHGKDLLFFKDADQLLKLINWYKNTGISEVGKIALSGREKVLSNYTWDNTIHSILSHINSKE